MSKWTNKKQTGKSCILNCQNIFLNNCLVNNSFDCDCCCHLMLGKCCRTRFVWRLQFRALWVVERPERSLSCLHARPSILTTVVLDEEVYYYTQWRNAFPLNATLIFSLVAVRVTHFHSEWNTPSDLCSRRNLRKPCFWRPGYWQVFMCVWQWRRGRRLCRQLDS